MSYGRWPRRFAPRHDRLHDRQTQLTYNKHINLHNLSEAKESPSPEERDLGRG